MSEGMYPGVMEVWQRVAGQVVCSITPQTVSDPDVFTRDLVVNGALAARFTTHAPFDQFDPHTDIAQQYVYQMISDEVGESQEPFAAEIRRALGCHWNDPQTGDSQ